MKQQGRSNTTLVESPLFEGPFTQVPNFIFDCCMRKLSSACFEVLMTIHRKTIGWKKSEDAISISQICGNDRTFTKATQDSIRHLVEQGIINKIKHKSPEGDDAPSIYSINFEALENGQGVVKRKYPLV